MLVLLFFPSFFFFYYIGYIFLLKFSPVIQEVHNQFLSLLVFIFQVFLKTMLTATFLFSKKNEIVPC